MIEEVSSERTVLHFCGNGAILKEQDVLLSTNGDGLHPVGQWVEGEATQCCGCGGGGKRGIHEESRFFTEE